MPQFKLLTAVIGLVVGILSPTLIPIHSSAANFECPTTWTERLPALVIKSYKGTVNGIPYQVWDNNLGSYQVLSNNLPTTNFNLSAPEWKKKLDSYGKDIIYKHNFEFSPESTFKKIKVLLGGNLGFRERDLLANGVNNGDYLRLSLFVEVNGCSPVTFYSNSVRLNGFLDSVVDVDTFLANVEKDTNGPINFKSKEIFKTNFSALILDLTKSVHSGQTRFLKGTRA